MIKKNLFQINIKIFLKKIVSAVIKLHNYNSKILMKIILLNK